MNMIQHVNGHTRPHGDARRTWSAGPELPTLTVSRFDGVVTFSETARHLCGGIPLDSPVCIHLLVCDLTRGDDAGSAGDVKEAR